MLSCRHDLLFLFCLLLFYLFLPSMALVIPILKPNKDETGSYRPIALLSCTGKLIEKIVQKRLECFVESNNILRKS